MSILHFAPNRSSTNGVGHSWRLCASVGKKLSVLSSRFIRCVHSPGTHHCSGNGQALRFLGFLRQRNHHISKTFWPFRVSHVRKLKHLDCFLQCTSCAIAVNHTLFSACSLLTFQYELVPSWHAQLPLSKSHML